jgi:hypothetical protein
LIDEDEDEDEDSNGDDVCLGAMMTTVMDDGMCVVSEQA